MTITNLHGKLQWYMRNTMYFLSGVSGVGKTSVMKSLRTLVTDKSIEIHDFDERGVPANAGHGWRLDETKYWISLGKEKASEGITVVVCGFMNPDELATIFAEEDPGVRVETILLDGDAQVIEERLRGRNADTGKMENFARAVGNAEAFIQNNTRFVPILREICQRHGCPTIDTTHKTPDEVAQDILNIWK